MVKCVLKVNGMEKCILNCVHCNFMYLTGLEVQLFGYTNLLLLLNQ
jgi:hypothetical protein